MSDAFAVFGALVALSAPIVAGPLGFVEPEHAIVLGQSERAGVSASAPAFYARGEEMGRLGTDNPTVTFEDLPETFVKALIAVEDTHFEQHMGVDPIGLSRAVAGVATGRFAGGGSTLSQQLAKNVITGARQTIDRKIEEAYSAVVTETLAEKNEILESYANAVFFGRRSQGAARAAQNWFDKEWDQLSLSENAFLAGVLQAPSALDPRRNPERAVARRDHVLNRMEQVGFITAEEAQAARAEPLEVSPGPRPVRSSIAIPDADFWALSEARRFIVGENLVDLAERGGYVSTLNRDAQFLTQEILAEQLARLNTRIPHEPLGFVPVEAFEADSEARIWRAARGAISFMPEGSRRIIVRGSDLMIEDRPALGEAPEIEERPNWLRDRGVYVLMPDGQIMGRPMVQGAAVVIDTATNETIASIGGYATWASQFDRTRAMRQPGSAIKTLIWLAALDYNYNPNGYISDEPLTFRDGDGWWTPRNYGRETLGLVPFFTAFERSLNVIAVRIADRLGMERIRPYLEGAQLYPFGEPRLSNLSTAIGAVETTPARMAMAMALIDPRSSDLASRSALEDLESMMAGVTIRGTAAGAFRDGPRGVVGKTGTSQSHRDTWFVGRTGDLAFAVWIGRDDDTTLPTLDGRRATGGAFAAPVAAKIVAGLRELGLSSEEINAPLFPPQQILPLERLEPDPPEPDYSAGRSPRVFWVQ